MEQKNSRPNTGTNTSVSDGLNHARHDNRFSPTSQCGEILAVLQGGRSITHYQAAQMGIMGFPARISELRAAGYPIVCTMQEHENKHGKTVKRGIYTLAAEKGAAV
ncbi:helix-turn-helix domain-containing protein [Neisseria weixii]|uniref:helix-turn-helix domain-containing protein n=1 Tax=Neisseria weixii TaxID=1853276 RepID=UPI000BB70C4E|nr:helix-turn-helix domain-containing protein [Neisseria weixii]ATD65396.1 hypothetical protein CGZ65_09035 [Neisseria weixii]